MTDWKLYGMTAGLIAVGFLGAFKIVSFWLSLAVILGTFFVTVYVEMAGSPPRTTRTEDG